MRVKTWAVVVCAGLVAGGAVVAQPPKTEPPKINEPAKNAPDAVKVAEPLATMLAESRTALGKVRDYTCTFTRQELRNGTLSGEQVAEMKVRTAPAGVYVRFAKPEAVAGMEIAYTTARKSSKMRYRLPGVTGAKGFQTLDVDDPKFLTDHRHPVTEWSMS